jgi:hypothetical protein
MDLAASLYEIIRTPVSMFLDVEDYTTDQDSFCDEEVPLSDQHDHVASTQSNELWTVDGCTGGIQLFAVPNFLERLVPRRIDIFIPDQRQQSFTVRKSLQSSSLCNVSSQTTAAHPLVRHVVQGLSHWIQENEDLRQSVASLPFGSQIVVSTITINPTDMPISLSPDYNVEWEMLSLKSLEASWNTNVTRNPMPPAIDLEDLDLIQQIQDSISLVRVRSKPEDGLLIFKSSTVGFYHLYNELYTLLTIPTHPNIIGSPRYVVCKHCQFGGKVGVCGFLTPYFELGSLANNLESLRREDDLIICNLAEQICEALLHLQNVAGIYYCDLRPDNMLLTDTEDGLRVVLIDFEQRGNWQTWVPPEVFRLEYLQCLGGSEYVPEGQRAFYKRLLKALNCEPESTIDRRCYTFTNSSCNAVWNSMSKGHQQSAMVYAFGKLLWCLFERVELLNNFDVIFHHGPDYGENIEFPTFHRTPPTMKNLILDCTKGAPEHKGRFPPVVRIGHKIYPRPSPGCQVDAHADSRTILEGTKKWWQEEVKQAEAAIVAHIHQQNGNVSTYESEQSIYTSRLSLFQVLHQIRTFKQIIIENQSISMNKTF